MFRNRKAFVSVMLIVVLGTLSCMAAYAGQQEEEKLPLVRASYQPCMHALPTILGQKLGWFEDLGIRVKPLYFASGMPQVEAGLAGEWDVGEMGTSPAFFAGMKYDFPIIGISNDESVCNNVMVREKAFDTWLTKPYAESLKGKKFLVTTISTGHHAVLAFLDKIGLSRDAVDIVHMEQPAILEASKAGQGDVFQTWCPFNYQHEMAGHVVLSNGKKASVTIPGAILATKKFAEEKPKLVAKWLRGYMKGVEYMIAHPAKAAWYLSDFYDSLGIELPYKYDYKEFKIRPLFGVNRQLMLMDRPKDGMSTLDKWLDDVAGFYTEVGRIDKKPDVRTFITDKFMKMVAQQKVEEAKKWREEQKG